MSKKLVRLGGFFWRKSSPAGEFFNRERRWPELEIPACLGDLWTKTLQVPMLAVGEDDCVIWHNRWCAWLFGIALERLPVRFLPAGEDLSVLIEDVRTMPQSPPAIRTIIRDAETEVVGTATGSTNPQAVLLRFHVFRHLPDTVLHVHKLMQDFALEVGDRVNNPLLTVINCMHMVVNNLPEGQDRHYLELAVREAYVMKEFGDWIRRLSEELPILTHFDLLAVLQDCLDRRGGDFELRVSQAIPPVIGSTDNAAMVLGGLINLIRQAARQNKYYVSVTVQGGFVHADIDCQQANVKDLRMLSEEVYGGLGLMAARYLLAMMHAHLELDYLTQTGIRVTFVTDLNI